MASATVPYTAGTEELSQLFQQHHRRVLLAAYRITGSMADAEDVTQTVFLRLAGDEVRAVKNAASYLYRAAINGALDLLRRRKNLEPLDVAGELPAGRGPESAATAGELRAWLRQALGELSPRAAEMFTLRYLEELDNPEIAKLLGTSQAVVAVTLHHARARLKNLLKDLERGKR